MKYMGTIILGTLGIIVVRAIDLYFFLKRVSSTCYKYDWKHIDHNGELLIEMLTDEDYTITREWSAYNFLLYKRPSPLEMYFSFKSFRIEAQYNKEVVERLRQYETI